MMKMKDLESDRTDNSVANNQAANPNLTRADGEQELDYTKMIKLDSAPHHIDHDHPDDQDV